MFNFVNYFLVFSNKTLILVGVFSYVLLILDYMRFELKWLFICLDEILIMIWFYVFLLIIIIVFTRVSYDFNLWAQFAIGRIEVFSCEDPFNLSFIQLLFVFFA